MDDLFCIPNLKSAMVDQLKPWELEIEKPRFKNKKAFVEWTRNPSTEGCHYSGFEGLNPHIRVGKDNLPIKVHALVLDFDAEPSAREFSTVLKRCQPKMAPNWVHKSYSGNARAIWLFEEPVFCYEPSLTKAFMKLLVKNIGAKNLWPGLDECYEDTFHYYEIGDSWSRLQEKPLSAEFLIYTLNEASSSHKWESLGKTQLPISVIADEVESRFPGRWNAEFEYGAQGCRFWDQTADNPRSSVIRESGMQCFTGPKPFVTWAEIFGRNFVKDYQSEVIGGTIKGIYFDGKWYWRKLKHKWFFYSRQDVLLYLKTKGLSAKTEGGEPSEIERALEQIQTSNRVSAAVPLVHRPDGQYELPNKEVINTSTIKAVDPAPVESIEWGENFELSAQLIETFFGDKKQRNIFLAWLQRFYHGCLFQKPNSGQAMLIGGPPGKGKTLLNTVLIGGLVGGHVDASHFLTGQTNYNSTLFESGLWSIDDTTPSADSTSYGKYSSIIKKMIANKEFMWSEKFLVSCMIPWTGRICITFNLDTESTRIIPDPEHSLLDKIIILRTSDKKMDFPPEAGEVVRKELPYLAAWLNQWSAPPETKSKETRYGVNSYHHPTLLKAAKQSTASAAFLELLELWFAETDEDEFVGTSTQLLSAMTNEEMVKPIAQTMSVDSVGRCLSRLSSQDFNIKTCEGSRKGSSRVWEISADLTGEGKVERAPKGKGGVSRKLGKGNE